MANKIQIRRGLKANLPALDVGEPALCTDTKEVFVGNSGGNVALINKEVMDSHLENYILQIPYGAASGSANTYTVILNPPLTSYTEGVAVAVKINASNTGASTININGRGAKSIRDPRGNALTAGKLIAGSIYTLRYNGTNFILQGEGATGNATASDLLSGKTATTDAGEITGTMPNRAGDNTNLASSVSATTLKLRAPKGYYDGIDDTVTITDTDFIASNIKSGVNLFGITGTMPIKPDDYRGSPGEQYLIKGDRTYGYFGFVGANDLITGNALASQVLLSSGSALNSDAGWLKFMYEEKILFIAKKIFRYGLSWDNINTRNLVFGAITIVLSGVVYKVRLLRAAVNNPTNLNPPGNSEWVKLLRPVVGTWDNLSDSDLGIVAGANGSLTWCQETSIDNSADRITIGGGATGASGRHGSSSTSPVFGWRPVLEVV